ncbi:dephospho-CoA kinase [secondary endosymbiont of Ctenarytaina eucalypti]|uniref:Dephospho-CoA kinase n=1 Tax=secondary endosymbiont of Ctenarytaina eucalypti TaxID=1199245 RepID=J3Z3C6_9ENTR|nr:dephospho-CoA kinase [secondary endosymbiont of Ctenarytaina eucalypti]AFP84739.1 dephospho-CoA kinase [secondary endosymbiont of Ctenarytaina eucalypti]
MTKYIVALTGGIGSGKTTVANAFSALGVPLVDADVIAREVVEPDSSALRFIQKRFGPAMLNGDGSLDRSALRARIFSNQKDKAWLNNLLHPLIKQQTEEQLCFVPAPYVLWVVPLLVDHKLYTRANRVLVVDVDREVQIRRTITRDGVSRDQVENIVDAQVPHQRRLAYADDIIDNGGRPDELTEQVATFHRRYLVLAALARQQDISL